VWELLPVMLDIERRQRVRFGLRVAGPEAKVVAIRDASPAARSGLKPGDRVTRVDGQRIGNAIDFYVQMLKHKPGDEVRIDYTRDQGDREEATVPLEVIPPPDGSALAKRLLGMDLDEFPPAIRRRYDLPDDVGLLVSDVRPRGPADRAGIMPGDLIVRVDRIPVPTLDDVGLALEGVDRGQRLIIEGIRVRADPPYRWIVQLRTAR
jgi:serine protease Do